MSNKVGWFVVSGSGEFPYDMLRYDHCFPAQEQESGKLYGHGKRRVGLLYDQTWGHLTPGRWSSFGWKVESQGLGSIIPRAELEGHMYHHVHQGGIGPQNGCQECIALDWVVKDYLPQ